MVILEWVKKNKLSSLLILVLGFLLFRGWFGNVITNTVGYKTSLQMSEGGYSDMAAPNGFGAGAAKRSVSSIMPPVYNDAAPAPEVTNRKVVQESDMSLLVKDVRDASKKIIATAEGMGGYMVSSNYSSPGESPTASIVIRVPATKLQTVLDSYRGVAIRVVSENLSGQDVTDQYVDIDARLAVLNATKAKFQDLMAKAVEISDMLNVQREIINLQSQIDSYKGQQLYLDKTAEMARVSVYLSTDEYSLPYAPSGVWRPEVVFKTAVRSLVQTVRSGVDKAIWIVVYGAIWIPVLIIGVFLYRRFKK
jgi:hypothetical protein